MIRPLFTLMLTILLASCDKKVEAPIGLVPDPPTPTNEIKYLALGDSYTIGQSVAVEDRYPIQFSNALMANGVDVDTTIIIAQTGWRTDNLAAAIESANLTDTFDLVSLLIGVNNQYQNKPISVYETEFEELLQTAIELAGGDKGKVFVISIPDYGYTPFGQSNQPTISEEIDTFNNINKSITESYQITWFDITPISREGLNDPELVASDGLHPSGKMYQQWMELFYTEVKNKLE